MELTKIEQDNIKIENNESDYENDNREEIYSLIEIDIKINYKMNENDFIYLTLI
uniref:Uncharacterized protein n=1 Tax=Meloidogyne hapla TaxID=6305 RepID=A0A1I8BLG6_MELHA